MGEVVAIANQKGGVGKTTTAINLAAALACLDKDVLIIDFDPQGNVTSGLGINISPSDDKTIYDVISGNATVESAIRRTPMEWMSVIPADRQLAGAEVELVSVLSRETVFSNAINPIRTMYDFIIVDCPPSLGLLTINALVAADSAITPVQCEFYSMEGLTHFMKTIQKIKATLNPELEVDGGVITMYDARNSLSSQVRDQISKYYGEKLYKTIIPKNVRLAESPGFGKPIFTYAPNSRGAVAYYDLGVEFLSRRGAEVEKYKDFHLCAAGNFQTNCDSGR